MFTVLIFNQSVSTVDCTHKSKINCADWLVNQKQKLKESKEFVFVKKLSEKGKKGVIFYQKY